MSVTAYRLAAAPPAAALRSWDCSFCAHAELARPVFLAGPGGIVAAGTGCAAVALGYANTTTARREVATEAVHLEHLAEAAAELEAERRTRYARARADFTAQRDAVNVPDTDALASCRRTYWQAGGFAELGQTFPDFLEQVAATGQLPAG